MDAAKKKSLSPAGLTALRVLLLLVVGLCLGQTRVWGLDAAPHHASGQIAVASASAVGEIAPAVAYDVSECPVAADTGAISWNPLNGPGPLGNDVAATFRSSSYAQTALAEDTTLYRAYGGNAGPLGSYWTRTAPSGPLQSVMDSALNPAWGNTAENVSTVIVPKGTTIFEGAAAPEGGLLGGGNQVYIPKVNPNWLVPTP
jgi:hypothetical protein